MVTMTVTSMILTAMMMKRRRRSTVEKFTEVRTMKSMKFITCRSLNRPKS